MKILWEVLLAVLFSYALLGLVEFNLSYFSDQKGKIVILAVFFLIFLYAIITENKYADLKEQVGIEQEYDLYDKLDENPNKDGIW